jgi:amidase
VLEEQALDHAEQLDQVRPEARLPLHGVPVAIKDDTDIAGQVTACGSKAFGVSATSDAAVVGRLRAAGAVIIGKTNVPELTLWPWTSSHAWGTTRNPWNPTTTPGGPSGGSAVAVATGIASMALGSDSGGSVRYPAALTGLFGIKPQRDRIPLDGHNGGAWYGLIAYGPLTRSVRDAAAFLDATADGAPPDGYLHGLDSPPKSLRIGIALDPPPSSGAHVTDRANEAINHVADLLRDLGHQLSTVRIDYGRGALWNSTVRYLKGAQHDVDQAADRNQLEPRTRRLAGLARLIPPRTLDRARQGEGAIAERINTALADVDLILTPIAFKPAPAIDDLPETGVLRSLRISNVSAWSIPWNTIGQPAASIPAGADTTGEPRAVQLCGRPNDELTILQLAHQLQKIAPWPRPNSKPSREGNAR